MLKAGRKRVRNTGSKDLIVEAAERVVQRDGPARLTLDAVAREAGLSKGGLLYNFPNKQSLVEGMILAAVGRHQRRFEEVAAKGDGKPETVIRGVIEASRAARLDRGVGLTLMAGLAENPDLLTPLRHQTRDALDAVRESGMNPLLATLLWLAVGGLDFMELLDVSPFPEEERKELESQMMYLAQTAETGGSGLAPAGRSPGTQ